MIYGLCYHESLVIGDYRYPLWADVVGWAIALSSMLMIPILSIAQLSMTPGTLKEVKYTKSTKLFFSTVTHLIGCDMFIKESIFLEIFFCLKGFNICIYVHPKSGRQILIFFRIC